MSEPEYNAHTSHAVTLGLPLVKRGTDLGELAVCGGGPSLADHLQELASYAAVWGINDAASWLNDHGVRATLFTVDPENIPSITRNVQRAILGSGVHPEIFKALDGKDVSIFHPTPIEGAPFIASGGVSSACRTPIVAFWMGYRSITFFGCEGSFAETSHVYGDLARKEQLIIRAGEQTYVTQPDYVMQSEYLAKIISDYPDIFKERSGGLLRSMVEHSKTWEVVAISERLAHALGVADPERMLPKYELAENFNGTESERRNDCNAVIA